jgi:DNA uptake protein ComE-like DNA-binding protein
VKRHLHEPARGPLGTALAAVVIAGSLALAATAARAAPPDLSAMVRVLAPAIDSSAATRLSQPAQIDLNQASDDQIRALPIPRIVAENILEHRTYRALFTSLFDLLEVEGMTPELLQRIRPLLYVTPLFEGARQEQADEEQRAGELNYMVQRLLSEEGASEGLVDQYLDQVRSPRNINRFGFQDLVSFQNVSPVDAVAILRERAQSGRFANARELRAAPGLSYWGFRNLRDFVRYDDPAPGTDRLHTDYQFRLYDTPYLLDDADILNENIIGNTSGLSDAQKANFRNFERNTYAGRLALDATDPAMTQKLKLRYGPFLKTAGIAARNLGEQDWASTAKGYLSLEDLPSRATPFGMARLHALVLGNYSVAFGQGLIMDNTDFFMPRRAGYGYSIRSIGAHGDLSRTDEYALRGAAFEGSLGAVHGTFFASRDNKDAILNPDGSFNTYIRMVPRLSNELLAGIRDDITSGVFAGRGEASAFLPMRDVMDERVTGANLLLELAPGTSIGFTGVQMVYRNNSFGGALAQRFNPNPDTLVIDPARLEERDSEMGAGYNSVNLGDYRRIWGGEAQTVWRNLALAGEYAKLETSAEPFTIERMLSAGPEARVTQAYLQLENFTALALYRDYDLGYDNPYDRAFSEDTRFEQTILDGNAFRLRNPYWAQLSRYVPQPKAERGWYFNTRYQFARQFLISGFEYDTWTRKADGADLRRVALRAEYRPIFPLRLRARHAISSRHSDRPDDIRTYTSWDTRLELLANLSAFDQLRFLFSTSNVSFADRPRLSAPAARSGAPDDTLGVRGIPARALQAAITHNFNNYLTATLSSEVYDGFLYNYEDNEFIVVDGKGYRNWFLLRSRLSDRLSWRFKWTDDHQLARTYVDIRRYSSGLYQLLAPTPDAVNAGGDRSSFRLQLDFSL